MPAQRVERAAMRGESEIRLLRRQAETRLTAAEAALRRCEADRDRIHRERDDRFSDEMMLHEAGQAAEGLCFSNLDELRSLKFAPPSIVHLVVRCVSTLVSGDCIGDAEAMEASERGPSSARGTPRQPHSARSSSPTSSARGRQDATSDRLSIPKQPDSARGRLYEPRQPNSARGQGATEKSPPLSARESRSIRGRHEAAERQQAAKGASERRPAVRESDARRTAKGELMTWDDTQKMLLRPDFKFRLMHLNGRALLDNQDLIDNVRTCLDLSNLKLSRKVAILPGRAHPSDRDAEVVERRELVKALYEAGAGVAESPLKFEEARYVNEVIGAMLIWMNRIFAQHGVLIQAWKRCSVACEAADKRVVAARKVVEERRSVIDAFDAELEALKRRHKEIQSIPKPTELTTTDKIVVGPPANLFFTNGRIAGVAPMPARLPARLQLPYSIRFYIRLKSYRVSFPFPSSISTKQYLHEARVAPGMEEAGPVASIPFDSAHVIGLVDQHLLSFCQLVVEVPSTPTINPSVIATRLSFHPRHEAQLHNYSDEIPRIITPVFAVGGDRAPTDRASSAPHLRGGDSMNPGRSGVERVVEDTRTALPSPAVQAGICPPLPIEPQAAIAIGNPLNRLSMEANLDEGSTIKGRSMRDASPRRNTPRSRTNGSARSASPSAKTAAARVAAYRADAMLRPLVARSLEGYLLNADELRKMRHLVEVSEARPAAFVTHEFGAPSVSMSSPLSAISMAGFDPRRQALIPSNIGGGVIAAQSHSQKLASLGSSRGGGRLS